VLVDQPTEDWPVACRLVEGGREPAHLVTDQESEVSSPVVKTHEQGAVRSAGQQGRSGSGSPISDVASSNGIAIVSTISWILFIR